MISDYHAAKHASTILDVLEQLAKLLGDKARPAEVVLALAREVLETLTQPERVSDPADIRNMAGLLRAEVLKMRAGSDAALAAKHAKPAAPAFDVSDEAGDRPPGVPSTK